MQKHIPINNKFRKTENNFEMFSKFSTVCGCKSKKLPMSCRKLLTEGLPSTDFLSSSISTPCCFYFFLSQCCTLRHCCQHGGRVLREGTSQSTTVFSCLSVFVAIHPLSAECIGDTVSLSLEERILSNVRYCNITADGAEY